MQLSKRHRSLDAHVTLCRLAGLDTKHGRLVTTNQDRLFEKALGKLRRISKSKVKKHVDIAPSLPPPKKQTWHSLTYAHGRLDNPADVGDNKTLVLTTADFGSAYLVDRWASKFVTELFRNFTVVFIGYSIDDQTMNYLVRALAAERESNPEGYRKAYAFAPYGGDLRRNQATHEDAIEVWDRKGVKAIPFDCSNGHQPLWDGLKFWADLHRGGGDARRRVASELGRHEPISISADDRDLMTWALQDKDGDTAKLFADSLADEGEGANTLNIKWLPILDELGLLKLSHKDHSVSVPIVGYTVLDQFRLHQVTFELGRWIAGNLHELIALEWVIKHGGVLHEHFRWMVSNALVADKKKDQPLIPQGMVKVWSQLAQKGYAYQLARKSRGLASEIPSLAPSDHQALQAFLDRLEPIPVFKASLRWREETRASPDPSLATSYCDISIHLLGIEHMHDLDSLKRNASDWDGALAVLADDLTTLLASAMSWKEAFDKAAPMVDDTYIDYRSVSDHAQNEHAKTWTILISLVRDAYEALAVQDQEAAVRLAHRWSKYHYPIFKRLVLHAATGGRDA